ncbi:MAG TPA: ROK family transcriptional regulator [Clostridiales bacterium]|nr:ROK family transcriptional regulator [Clostridiales bacterium]
MITGSKELIRDINSTLVLETIINKGSISRANISKELGLTKTTVSSIVVKLLEKNFVLEVGSDNTKLGRKPILLAFNANAGYVISIEIGVDKIIALQSDLLGEKIKVLERETPNDNEGIRDVLVEIIDCIKQKAESSTYGLIGITLGIHGVIHNDQISFTPYYSLSEFDLSSFLNQRFNTKVFIENEANLSVLGELSYMPNYKNIASISVHSGVGLGLFINGDLYTGFSGYAGEIGHTIVDVDGRDCPCGNKGCLEQYLSEKALLKEFKEATNLDYVDFDMLSSMYKLANKDAIAIFQKFVKYMTVCINNILNLYNPDIVIINSSFTHHFPELTKDIEHSLNSRLNDVLHIYPSKLHHTSILLGGVSVAVKDFLDINDLRFVSK